MPAGGCPAQRRRPLGFLLAPEYSGARNLSIIKEESQPDLKCLLDEELSCLLSSDVPASSILFFVSQDGACISMAFSTQKPFFPQGATTAEQHGAGWGVLWILCLDGYPSGHQHLVCRESVGWGQSVFTGCGGPPRPRPSRPPSAV